MGVLAERAEDAGSTEGLRWCQVRYCGNSWKLPGVTWSGLIRIAAAPLAGLVPSELAMMVLAEDAGSAEGVRCFHASRVFD